MKTRFDLVFLSLLVLAGCATNAQYTMDDAITAYRDGDYRVAFRELSDFAAKGDRIAQGLLGHMYHDGLGIGFDYTKAAWWFGKSAEQGDDDAQLMLGYQYLVGEGVTRDYELAMQWFQKSAVQGNARAEY